MKTIEIKFDPLDFFYDSTSRLFNHFGFKIHGIGKNVQEIELPNDWTTANRFSSENILVVDSLNRARGYVYLDDFIFMNKYFIYSDNQESYIATDVVYNSIHSRITLWKCKNLVETYKKLYEKCPAYEGARYFERIIAYWDEEIDFNS